MTPRTQNPSELVITLRDYFPPQRLRLFKKPFTKKDLPLLMESSDNQQPFMLELDGLNLWTWKAELRARFLWQYRASQALPIFASLHTKAYLLIRPSASRWYGIASSVLPPQWEKLLQPNPPEDPLLVLHKQPNALVCTFDHSQLLIELMKGLDLSFSAHLLEQP